MKVLWFSNSPGNAKEHLGDKFVGSSWIPALDKRMQGKVELHVAFYYSKSLESFKVGETTYYPIGNKNWKLRALLEILTNKVIDTQDLYRYLEIINLVKPDIIHIHGTENPFGCIIPYTSIPVVISIQGYLTVISHKYQNNFTKRNLKVRNFDLNRSVKAILLSKSFYRSKKALGKRMNIERKNLLSSCFIIGRTDWDRRVTSILAPNSKYYHCDEIIRDIFFKTEWKGNNNSKIVIHSTIGNKPYKGLETVCEALHELNKLSEVQIEWQIAGIDQTDLIVKVIKRKLKKKYPTTGLKYLGQLNAQQLALNMSNADLFVSPSHIENSSNSLCEAMVMGMPCIATYAGGTGSMLTDGVEGILIQDGDPWVLAGSILEIYRNPQLAKKFSYNSRKRAFNRHNPDFIVNELIKYYEEILHEIKEKI